MCVCEELLTVRALGEEEEFFVFARGCEVAAHFRLVGLDDGGLVDRRDEELEGPITDQEVPITRRLLLREGEPRVFGDESGKAGEPSSTSSMSFIVYTPPPSGRSGSGGRRARCGGTEIGR